MTAVHASTLIPRQHIARSFGRAVRTYDQCAELQRHVGLRLLDMLDGASHNIRTADYILDAGCGTGFCTAELQMRYPDATVVALDLAEPMARVTQQRAVNAVPLCADIQQLPLRSEQFDRVLSSLTIQWCGDLMALFTELYRVTRAGGRVLLSTFGPQTLRELRAAWAGVDAHRHTSEFTDEQAILNAALRAGFSATLTKELRIQHYPSLRVLAAELKGLGAHNLHPGQHQGLTSPGAFRSASAAFAAQAQSGSGVPVSWEVFYLELKK
jgi:malonyl-CoA O-methyltransferase